MITQENIPYTNDEIKAMVKTCEKYNKALERAQKMQENSNGMILKKWLWSVFPEIKESDDELTRKSIIELVKQSSEILDKQNQKDMIAWLESQAEQSTDKIEPNPVWSKEDEEMLTWLCRIIHSQRLDRSITLKDESELGKWIDKWLNHNPQIKQSEHLENYDEDERIRKELITHFRNTRCVTKEGAERIVEWIAWLEKQGEQPTDKVEPKFHEGDWITTTDEKGNVTTEKIIEFCGDKVRLIDINGFYSLWPKHELNYYHLWTIADANDGDVLVDSYSKDSIIILYKGIDKERNIFTHCGWNGYNLFVTSNEGLGYGGLDNN